MYDQSVVANAKAKHQAKYGSEPVTVAYAPGRIEVLGNHTDYNGGTALSAAINFGHCFCISPSSTSGVTVFAGDLDETVSFDPSTDERVDEKFSWGNYVKGVIHYLHVAGAIVENVNCTFMGTVPMGNGLSSSAALEVATALAIIDYSGATISNLDIAKLTQKAENIFAGCNSGLLDQLSSINGVDNSLIHCDFSSLETSPVSLPDDAVFLVINPHVNRKLNESPYNERRLSCEKAAKELDELTDYSVKTLRDVNINDFNSLKDKIDPEAAKRATHVIEEINRVEEGIKFLKEDNLQEFGQLLYASHETSKSEFENSTEVLDHVVAAASQAGAIGARLSGGGWGGCAIALVRSSQASQVGDKLIELCQEHDIQPSYEVIVPSQGAQIIHSRAKEKQPL